MAVSYQQVLPDSCLPACLLMVLSELKVIPKPSLALETEILIEGGKLGRLNRSFGHLSYTVNKYQLRGVYCAEKQWVLAEAKSIQNNSQDNCIALRKQIINTENIKKLLAFGPVIVGVDNYTFNHDFHFPHFVLVEKIKDQNFQLIEPWQGKRLIVSETTLQDAINNLENTILYWKELIQIAASTQKIL